MCGDKFLIRFRTSAASCILFNTYTSCINQNLSSSPYTVFDTSRRAKNSFKASRKQSLLRLVSSSVRMVLIWKQMNSAKYDFKAASVQTLLGFCANGPVGSTHTIPSDTLAKGKSAACWVNSPSLNRRHRVHLRITSFTECLQFIIQAPPCNKWCTCFTKRMLRGYCFASIFGCEFCKRPPTLKIPLQSKFRRLNRLWFSNEPFYNRTIFSANSIRLLNRFHSFLNCKFHFSQPTAVSAQHYTKKPEAISSSPK